MATARDELARLRELKKSNAAIAELPSRAQLNALRLRKNAADLGAIPGVALTPEQVQSIQQGVKITPSNRRLTEDTKFKPINLTPDKEKSLPESLLDASQLGATRVGAGLSRLFNAVDPTDLDIVMGVEEAQLTNKERPITQFVGEVIGESAALPIGGVGKSLAPRLLTSAGAGAFAGGLSEAGRGGDTADIIKTSLIGGAFGPVGEVIGDAISKGAIKSSTVFRKLLRGKGATIVDNKVMFPKDFAGGGRLSTFAYTRKNGELTDEALSAIDKMGITAEDFRNAFSDVDIEDLTGLDPDAAFRVARARKEGVNLSRGQATRDFGQLEAEDILKTSATSEGTIARGFFTDQQTDLISAKDNFLRKLTDEIDISRGERGANVRATLIDINQAERDNVASLYRHLSELPGGNTQFETSQIKDGVDQIINDFVPSDRIEKGLDNIFKDFSIGGIDEDIVNIKAIKGFERTGTRLFTGVTPGGKRVTKGLIKGPAFFTPRKEIAEEFGGEVLEVFIPDHKLKIDFDLPGQKLLDIDDANNFLGTENLELQDFIDQGRSVGVEEDVILDPKRIIKKSRTFQGPLSFKNAEKFRARLNRLNPSEQSDIAAVSSIKQLFDDVVSGATESFPENSAIGQAAISARKAAADRFSRFKAKDIIEDLISFKKGTQTERITDEMIFDKLFIGSNKKIDNIKRVRAILLKNPTKESAAAWRQVQAQGVMDILGKAVTETPDGFFVSGLKLNSSMGRFGDDALKELLTPGQLKGFKNIQAIIGDATIPVKGTTNPSGTTKRLFNILGRMFNASGDGITGKVSSMIGAGSGAIKNVSQRKQVLTGILKGAQPQAKANALLRLSISIPSTRAAIQTTQDDN